MTRKKYIRFKPIPPSGKSSIYFHGNKIGEQIGTGSDNEPLIKDVVVLSEITDMFYKKNNGKEEI